MSQSEVDHKWMARAIDLAIKGKGFTAPNPVVGAVIVKDGRVVGEGYHKKAGADHAEVAAMKSSEASLIGSTAYVTLEPCNHTGSTGPCAIALLKAGVARVVIGASDKSPKMGKRGAVALRKAGVAVKTGVLKKECEQLVADFTKHSATGFPYVTLKTAMTIDGKVATFRGDSKWITSQASRKRVHVMRRESDAIMVGISTVLLDDPELTARYGAKGRKPLRIVVDSYLRIPLGSKLVKSAHKTPLLVATTSKAGDKKVKQLEKDGVTILKLPQSGGKVSLKPLLTLLGKMGVMSLLLEGGGKLSGAFVDKGLVDKVAFFIAPKIVGGGYCAINGKGVGGMGDAMPVNGLSVTRIGPDILLEGAL